MPDRPEVPEPLMEALFVAVGLGVLAAQRANVKRLDFERRYADELGTLETKVAGALEQLEGSLPEPARSWLHSTVTAGAAAQERLRHLLGSA